MSKLPLEVLNIVFSYMHKNDVLNCGLTCKNWKESALQFFYKDFSINGWQVSFAKKQLQLNSNERDRYFQYGTFTKRLIIINDDVDNLRYDPRYNKSMGDTYFTFEKEEWIMLLKYLPNLQILDVSRSENATQYLKYILGSTDSDKILLKIKVIVKNNNRTFRFNADEFNDIRFAVCYKYRATITTLEVEYKKKIFKMGSIRGKMLTLLSHFNDLTHLSFDNSYNDQLTTFDIMNACQHLISLDYKSSYEIPDSIVKRILDDDIINLDNLNDNLRELQLSVPTIPKNYATYLKDCSLHLNTLILQIIDLDVFDWVNEIGLDNALNLLRSLGTVKSVNIQWHPDKYYRRDSINDKSDVTIFFTLLNAMKINKKMYCQIEYGDFRSVHKSICNSNGELSLEYGLDYSDYYQESDEEITPGNKSNSVVEIQLPDLSISKIGLEIINQMQVIMCDSHPNLLMEFLKYALKNCPHLQYFSYSSMNHPRNGLCIGTDVNMNVYHPGKRNDLSNTTQENIKVVKTRQMFPSKELLDLMSTYMPAIEILICGMENYIDPSTELFVADLTVLQHLTLVQLDVRIFGGKRQDTKFLKIQFSNEDCEYYCLETNFGKLTVTAISLEYMKEQISSREDGNLSKVIIKCHKHVKFALCDDFSKFTEIDHGVVRELNDESFFTLFSRFLLR